MTLAIQWGDDNATDLVSSTSGFIYFDAVSAYTKSFTGQVTKHPVDSGGNISDHFIVENPRFIISAVITGQDISTGSFLVEDELGNTPYNVVFAPSAVSVKSTDQSVLKKFIPDSIGQFLPDSQPEVQVDEAKTNLLENIQDLLERLVYNRENYDDTPANNKINLLKILEFDGSVLRRTSTSVVMTSISFKEDANTGYGLYCDMTFEKVTFSFLQETVLPKNIVSSLSKKASPKAVKKKETGTEVIEPDEPRSIDRDGARTPYDGVAEQERFKLGQPLGAGAIQ